MEKLMNIFKEVFDTLPDNIEEIDVLNVDGWDSLGHVMLMDRIEEVYGIHIPEDDYLMCTSFQLVLEEIAKLEDAGEEK